MKYLLLIFLALPFVFVSCKDDPSECETFTSTKGEIQFWQPAGRSGKRLTVQAENNSVFAGTVIFKLNKQYDEVRWLINRDSNYTYTTKEVTLGFNNPLRTYTVSAIGTKFINSKECGNKTYIDTITSSFRTFKPSGAIGIFGKKYEIESTEYPGEKWTFYFQNINGPINDYTSGLSPSWSDAATYPDRTNAGIDPPYLIAVNFPRYENDSFMIRSFETDGYTFFEGKINMWDSVQPSNNFRIATSIELHLEKPNNSNEVSGEYFYIIRDRATGFPINKKATFKGVTK
jgi:hypothetical protein